MKISARNQFRGTVSKVNPGAVNATVEVTLEGGATIVAVITNDSLASMGIEVGKEAIALVKASNVLVMTDAAGIRLSARNCLQGMVKEIITGPVSAEVTIALGGGEEVHATITHGAVEALGLTEGMPASAVFKAPSVILGVPD